MEVHMQDKTWAMSDNKKGIFTGLVKMPLMQIIETYRKYLEYTFNFYDNRYKLVCHGTLFCTRIVT